MRRMVYAVILLLLSCGCTSNTSTFTEHPSPSVNLPDISSLVPITQAPLIIDYDVECADGYTANIKKTKQSTSSNQGCRYTITQGKDGTLHLISISSSDTSSSIILSDDNEKNSQTINIESPNVTLTFLDINLDGYIDLQARVGGTLNEENNLYLWSPDSQRYTEVICSEPIYYYEVYDGFIKNWAKSSSSCTVVQYLEWEDENTLILDHEVSVDLDS